MKASATALLLVAPLAGATACLEFDGPTGTEGLCFDPSSGRYAYCDAGAGDAGPLDAVGGLDASPVDMGFSGPDAMWVDATPVDVGVLDTGVHPDAEPIDAGFADSGVHPDAEPMDVGFVDAGFPDSGLPPQRLVQVFTAGAGIDCVVVSAPSGIDCHFDRNLGQTGVCSATFSSSVTVQLGASPRWNFSGWGGDCAAFGPFPICDLDLTAPGTRTAFASF